MVRGCQLASLDNLVKGHDKVVYWLAVSCVRLSCPAAQPNATTAAPGWATKETAPLASKQTMHPCESQLLFVFCYLPRFHFPVLNSFDWLKQPSRFTLHPHLLLWHMYYTYIASLGGGFYGCVCTELFSAWNAPVSLKSPSLIPTLLWLVSTQAEQLC